MAAQLTERRANGQKVHVEISKLKQEKADLVNLCSNLQSTLTNCRSDCERLKARVVQNPEQIKQTIKDMQASLASLKGECDAFEQASRNLQTKLESLSQVENDIEMCLQLIKECEVEQAKVEELMQVQSSATDEVYRKQAEIREVGLKEQQLKRQQQSTTEKLARLHAQVDSKRQAMDLRLEALRQEWSKSGKERSDLQDQLDKYDEVINETRQKIQQMKQQHDSEVSSLQADFQKLKQQVMVYIGDLRKEMVINDTM